MWMRFFCTVAVFATVSLCSKTKEKPAFTDAEILSHGSAYCSARCLASCVETSVGRSLEQCLRFCPPNSDLLCGPDDVECWRTCGVPNDGTSPGPVSFIPPPRSGVDDPFATPLAWSPVQNASLYIVEFFPDRNQPDQSADPGSVLDMTSDTKYIVRGPHKCERFIVRVIAVNAFGLSPPSDIVIRPAMLTHASFEVQSIERNLINPNTIVAAIDYFLPLGWDKDEVDFTFDLSASDCKGPLDKNLFPNGASKPVFDYDSGTVDKIVLGFFYRTVEANCLFKLRLASLTSVCSNITITFDVNASTTPGVDFRLNCETVDGAICQIDQSSAMVMPHSISASNQEPVITIVSADNKTAMSAPVQLPLGVVPGDTSAAVDPVLPPLPSFPPSNLGTPSGPVIPMPPGGVSVIEGPENGSGVMIAPMNPNGIPPMCDLDKFDVQPVPSNVSSLIDLTVTWLERQPLPPLPTPNYFVIRYGPLVRYLVDDDREKSDIVPGAENIIRTGQPGQKIDPTRHIDLPPQQLDALLKIQICAIYDPPTEILIDWDQARSWRVDLAALEPFLEVQDTTSAPPAQVQNMPLVVISEIVPAPAVAQTSTPVETTTDAGPIFIVVQDDTKSANTWYWLSTAAAILLVLATVVLVFSCFRRSCRSHRKEMKTMEKDQSVIYFVNTPSASNPTLKTVLPA